MRMYDRHEVAEMLMHSNTLYRRLVGREQEFGHHPEHACALCHRTFQRNPQAASEMIGDGVL